MKRFSPMTLGGLSSLAAVGLFAAIIFYAVAYMSSVENIEILVTDKERVCSGGEQVTCEYLVFTKTETFANKDSLPFWKFNSSDVQGRLEEGGTYQVRVAGWRIPWLSQYRNIIGSAPQPLGAR